VEITGTLEGLATIDIQNGGDGAEVHTLALTGPRAGIGISGAEDVLVDRVWAHHNEHAAIAAERTLGATSLRIEGSLIEHALDFGIFADSIDLTMSRSVLRDSKAGPFAAGRGLNLQTTKHAYVANATITSSVFERNAEIGIFVFASQLTLEGSVIQDTLPNELDEGGRALNIEDDPDTAERSTVTVRSTVFQRNGDIEVTCTGCDLMMEATTLRDTRPMASDMTAGRCFSTLDRAGRPNVTLRECVLTRCNDAGVVVDGGDVLLESVLIRGIASQVSDLGSGRGLSLQYGVETPQRGNLTLRWSVIEDVREFGVTCIGSDLRVEGSVVRNVKPLESNPQFGDGITLFTTDQPTNAWIVGSLIEGTARAGVSSFGGAIEIAATALQCNPIHLNAEPFEGVQGSFKDGGQVVCGCNGATESCSVSAAQLQPPPALELE
jgi:hypothetical protein